MYNVIVCIFAEVWFYNFIYSEFLVLSLIIPGMIISEEKSGKSNVMILCWHLLSAYKILLAICERWLSGVVVLEAKVIRW